MMHRSTPFIALLGAGLLGCQSVPAAAPAAASTDSGDTSPTVNYEGLETVASRRLDIAQLRPGVDFSAYQGMVLSDPELAFRTPAPGEGRFPLDEKQKQKIRGLLANAFDDELANLKSLDLVAEPGPGVLALQVRVVDIGITVSDESLSGVGRAQIGVRASADATVVLELSDSQSGELLARGVDSREVQGAAIRQGGDRVTTGFDTADKVVAKWAKSARRALDTLTRR